MAVAELEVGEDDAEPDSDFESEVDPDVGLPLEPGSDLPFELDCSEPE